MLRQRFALHTYDELKHGAAVRLAHYRRKAGMLAARLQTETTWRSVRYRKLSDRFPKACPGFNGSRPVLSCFDVDALPVRNIEFSDEVIRLRHRGWFADCEGYGDRGVIRGIVASLPHGRFIAGYHWSDNGEYVIFTDRTYSDKDEAARAGDSEAESYADDCRDDDERFRALTSAEGHAESMEWDCRMAIEARNVSPAHREHARDRIAELKAARADVESARRAYERG